MKEQQIIGSFILIGSSPKTKIVQQKIVKALPIPKVFVQLESIKNEEKKNQSLNLTENKNSSKNVSQVQELKLEISAKAIQLGGVNTDIYRMRNFLLDKKFQDNFSTTLSGKQNNLTLRTMQQIQSIIFQFLKRKEQFLILYYSGHGFGYGDKNDETYLGDWCFQTKQNPNGQSFTFQKLTNLWQKALKIKTQFKKKLMIIMDSCHSGKWHDKLLKSKYKKSISLHCSSLLSQLSIDLGSKYGGYFTYNFCQVNLKKKELGIKNQQCQCFYKNFRTRQTMISYSEDKQAWRKLGLYFQDWAQLFGERIWIQDKQFWRYQNGDQFKGQIINEKRQGKSEYFLNNQDDLIYVGLWKDDKMDGSGILKKKYNQKQKKQYLVYDGEWKNGLYQGKGKKYISRQQIHKSYSYNSDRFQGYEQGNFEKGELVKKNKPYRIFHLQSFSSYTRIRKIQEYYNNILLKKFDWIMDPFLSERGINFFNSWIDFDSWNQCLPLLLTKQNLQKILNFKQKDFAGSIYSRFRQLNLNLLLYYYFKNDVKFNIRHLALHKQNQKGILFNISKYLPNYHFQEYEYEVMLKQDELYKKLLVNKINMQDFQLIDKDDLFFYSPISNQVVYLSINDPMALTFKTKSILSYSSQKSIFSGEFYKNCIKIGTVQQIIFDKSWKKQKIFNDFKILGEGQQILCDYQFYFSNVEKMFGLGKVYFTIQEKKCIFEGIQKFHQNKWSQQCKLRLQISQTYWKLSLMDIKKYQFGGQLSGNVFQLNNINQKERKLKFSGIFSFKDYTNQIIYENGIEYLENYQQQNQIRIYLPDNKNKTELQKTYQFYGKNKIICTMDNKHLQGLQKQMYRNNCHYGNWWTVQFDKKIIFKGQIKFVVFNQKYILINAINGIKYNDLGKPILAIFRNDYGHNYLNVDESLLSNEQFSNLSINLKQQKKEQLCVLKWPAYSYQNRTYQQIINQGVYNRNMPTKYVYTGVVKNFKMSGKGTLKQYYSINKQTKINDQRCIPIWSDVKLLKKWEGQFTINNLNDAILREFDQKGNFVTQAKLSQLLQKIKNENKQQNDQGLKEINSSSEIFVKSKEC